MMLIEQNYEPLVKYDEETVKLVLNLPKKVLKDTSYIFTLRLRFIEATYIHVAYIGEDKEVLVEMIINLNEHTSRYIDQLLDFFEQNKVVSVQTIEEGINEYRSIRK